MIEDKRERFDEAIRVLQEIGSVDEEEVEARAEELNAEWKKDAYIGCFPPMIGKPFTIYLGDDTVEHLKEVKLGDLFAEARQTTRDQDELTPEEAAEECMAAAKELLAEARKFVAAGEEFLK